MKNEDSLWDLPSGYVKIAIENDHEEWIFPLNMVIFNSYVKLPEGNEDGIFSGIQSDITMNNG